MPHKRHEVSNADIERLKDKVIQDYFYEHYDNTDVTPYGLCSLCGNMGVIDTRGRAISGAGIDAGRLNYCICPNGDAGRNGIAPGVSNMKGMTGERAIRILKWVEGTLKWANPEALTPFERELLTKCNDIEINVPGYGRVPTIEVKDIAPEMILVFEDGPYWEVESVLQVENSLIELTMFLNTDKSKRKIIRKRPTTRIGYIR
jgi:hypothetical protein